MKTEIQLYNEHNLSEWEAMGKPDYYQVDHDNVLFGPYDGTEPPTLPPCFPWFPTSRLKFIQPKCRIGFHKYEYIDGKPFCKTCNAEADLSICKESHPTSDNENKIPVPNAFQFAGCEGSCEKHRGEVKQVEVKCQWHPDGTWGMFKYCEEAIEEDKRRGINPVTLKY